MPRPRVGVLALQGDFAAHEAALGRLGYRVHEVRTREELWRADGLVLPGGESTTLLKLLHEFDLWDELQGFARIGRAMLCTCAGLILAAERVTNPEQESLGILPVEVKRNAYGRQVDSFVASGRVVVPEDLAPLSVLSGDGRVFETEFVFIRAPVVTKVGEGVEVLARFRGDPILVRRGNVLGATFHPELARDSGVMCIFAAMVEQSASGGTVR